ncbi:MAG TPA: hypothetical protein VFW73_12635 [Lacipirellulaceae bacterium]|nr:hypothetical protein [Lacipirellulaceae bacterium]
MRPRDDEVFVQAISMQLRVPEVIVLLTYDRQPISTVTFNGRDESDFALNSFAAEADA